MSLRSRSEISSTSGFPVFTHNLWKILSDKKNEDTVAYVEDDTFEIANVNKFMHIMLPRYYKMSDLKRWYRHLELWGFTKLYTDVPRFKHPKWDRNNKACLHDISKQQVVQKRSNTSRGVSHHLRTKMSPSKFEEKLEAEIRQRQALEREVADLRKIVERLSDIVSARSPETPKTDSTDVQSNYRKKSSSSKRSIESAEFVSDLTPKKKRKLKQISPEITAENDQGSNPSVERPPNMFILGNVAFPRHLEGTLPTIPARPKTPKASGIFDNLTRSSPTPRKINVNKEIVDCPENITMLRPASRSNASEIHDHISLKTEVLEAQICWSET